MQSLSVSIHRSSESVIEVSKAMPALVEAPKIYIIRELSIPLECVFTVSLRLKRGEQEDLCYCIVDHRD